MGIEASGTGSTRSRSITCVHTCVHNKACVVHTHALGRVYANDDEGLVLVLLLQLRQLREHVHAVAVVVVVGLVDVFVRKCGGKRCVGRSERGNKGTLRIHPPMSEYAKKNHVHAAVGPEIEQDELATELLLQAELRGVDPLEALGEVGAPEVELWGVGLGWALREIDVNSRIWRCAGRSIRPLYRSNDSTTPINRLHQSNQSHPPCRSPSGRPPPSWAS